MHCYFREIPQNCHRMALFDPPRLGEIFHVPCTTCTFCTSSRWKIPGISPFFCVTSLMLFWIYFHPNQRVFIRSKIGTSFLSVLSWVQIHPILKKHWNSNKKLPLSWFSGNGGLEDDFSLQGGPFSTSMVMGGRVGHTIFILHILTSEIRFPPVTILHLLSQKSENRLHGRYFDGGEKCGKNHWGYGCQPKK